LGQGGFGKVMLANKKGAGEVDSVAIKVVSKDAVLSQVWLPFTKVYPLIFCPYPFRYIVSYNRTEMMSLYISRLAMFAWLGVGLPLFNLHRYCRYRYIMVHLAEP
jgi:hypothetical protein